MLVLATFFPMAEISSGMLIMSISDFGYLNPFIIVNEMANGGFSESMFSIRTVADFA